MSVNSAMFYITVYICIGMGMQYACVCIMYICRYWYVYVFLLSTNKTGEEHQKWVGEKNQTELYYIHTLTSSSSCMERLSLKRMV